MKKIWMSVGSCIKENDDIWFNFSDINAVGKYNCKSQKGTLEKIIPVTSSFAGMYSACTIYGDRLIFFPATDDKVTVYNKKTGDLQLFPLEFEANDQRYCCSAIFNDFAYIFSSVWGESVLRYDFQNFSLSPDSAVTELIWEIIPEGKAIDFFVKSINGEMYVLDRLEKRLVCVDIETHRKFEISLKNIKGIPANFYLLGNDLWLSMLDSTAIYRLENYGRGNVQCFSPAEENYLKNKNSYPYAELAKCGDTIIASNFYRAKPLQIKGNEICDIDDDSHWKSGTRGYGYVGMYSHIVPWEQYLILLPVNSDHIIYLDSSASIKDAMTAEIDVDDDIWHSILSSIFCSGKTVSEGDNIGLRDLFRNIAT